MNDEYQGYILRVDMTSEEVERFIVDEETIRKYIGGTGLGAKILYDEVPPKTEWSDPNNRLIFATGPLNATSMGGSGSTSVVTKGALTNGAGCSQANGYFGAYLRLCGLFGIIIQGTSKELKYLHIDPNKAELLDAEWLRAMNTYTTADLLKHEHRRREKEMSVASIGLAGENKVKFAGIFFDHGHSASHNGLGAVMGSKGLKAIGVERGDQKIQIRNPEIVREIAKTLIENVKVQAKNIYEYGTLKSIHGNASMNMIPVKNYTSSKWLVSPEVWQTFSGEYIREKFSIRRNPCWACQIHHCDIMKITEGPYAGEILEEPEYEQFVAWSSNIGNKDITSTMMLSKEVDNLGMDTNEAGWIVGFSMECYERGILTKEDLNNLDMSWGNAESARILLNVIAKREGIGNDLAEGVMRAAKKIGKKAQDLAIHTTKGNTPRGHDHRNRTTEQFDTAISNTGTLETWGSPTVLGSYPNWEEIVAANLHDKGAMMFEDSLVTCRFNTRMNMDLLSKAVSAVTGWDFSYDEAYRVGRRIVHLLRAFNIRHGISGREFDKLSKRYGSAPDAGEGSGKSLEKVWDKMLDRYYDGMGWDTEGKPLPKTLMSYGLEHVSKDIWK